VSIRPIKRVAQAQPTIEGAGVRLRRAFGFGKTDELDPFLLLDDFRNENPDDYLAGFPWHAHRGIETITYVLVGEVGHGDSLGNSGKVGAGDVQWMTAGSGILHQEMPREGCMDSSCGKTYPPHSRCPLLGTRMYRSYPASESPCRLRRPACLRLRVRGFGNFP